MVSCIVSVWSKRIETKLSCQTLTQCCITFWPKFINVRNKLECISVSFQPSSGVRAEPTSVKHLSGVKHKNIRLDRRPARDKHSTLLQTFTNYCRKKFHKIGPRQHSGSNGIKIEKVWLRGSLRHAQPTW